MSLELSTLAHRRWLISFENAAAREAVAALEKRTGPLLQRLQRYGERLQSGRPLTARQRAQAERDRARLLRLYRRANADVRAAAQQRMERAIQTELRVSVRNLSAGLPEGITARAPGVDLRTLITSPTAGSPWTRRLDAQLVQTYQRVDAALAIAINRGASIPNAARLVGDAVRAVEGQQHQVTRLVRTEIQRVSNEAAQATYRENRDVVKAVRYLATLDARVCPICRPDHRKVYPLDAQGNYTGPTVPRHPNCRCFLSPVTRSIAEILAAAAA